MVYGLNKQELKTASMTGMSSTKFQEIQFQVLLTSAAAITGSQTSKHPVATKDRPAKELKSKTSDTCTKKRTKFFCDEVVNIYSDNSLRIFDQFQTFKQNRMFIHLYMCKTYECISVH